MRVQMKTEIGPFEGSPQAGELVAVLNALPAEASVRVETWASQRDGDGWRVHAAWEEER